MCVTPDYAAPASSTALHIAVFKKPTGGGPRDYVQYDRLIDFLIAQARLQLVGRLGGVWV